MGAASNQLDDLLAEMQCELYGAVKKSHVWRSFVPTVSTRPILRRG
jgi:hypothetical protein